MNDDVCQVRLELEKFQLSDPDGTGQCKSKTDSFQVILQISQLQLAQSDPEFYIFANFKF